MSAAEAEPGPHSQAAPRNPISRAQFERAAAGSVAGFGLVFGAQSVPSVLAQLPWITPPWGIVSVCLFFGGLIAVAAAALLNRFVSVTMSYVAVSYLVIVLTWPLTVEMFPSAAKPWVWYVCTVATACAAVAFPIWLAAFYTALAPAAYGYLHAQPSGGGVRWELAGLDGLYAFILGGAILVMMWMLRQATTAVDRAQTRALERYGEAVRQHATEVERVEVDSIVHDSVLTTLLAAANATTPESKALAATMARDAIGHLHAAEAVEPDDRRVVTLGRLAARIRSAALAFSVPFDVELSAIGERTLPLSIAEALYSSAVQAMVNSTQHAGDGHVVRSVSVSGGGARPFTIVIADDGVGFDPEAVPAGRLGVRVSIIDRVVSIGGKADVRSRPGAGTVVTVVWPVPTGEPGPTSEMLEHELALLDLDLAPGQGRPS